jgi:two-component system, chemotaxis family, protein-glutamate methylesterase/glutaminase
MGRKVRVLVVDDSALVRQILTAGLAQDPDIEVVGAAADAYAARDKILQLSPDVLTLDVEMPRMDGVDFLRRLMAQKPMPVIMVSALTERGAKITLDALSAGAVDFVEKPKADLARGLESMLGELRSKVRTAATANVARLATGKSASPIVPLERGALAQSTDKVIAIGASTGGTEAIRAIVERLPRTTPGVVIVQHMPARFTTLFAERLATVSAMEVVEAKHGDRVLPGRVLIAPGGLQTRVIRCGGFYSVEVTSGAPVNNHAPSVELMMQSVARHVGSNAVGVMLTGMGGDGAEGLLAMRKAGARTIAQDESTCVVFGMPRVALEKGAVERMLPLDEIAGAILTAVARQP